MGAVSAVSLLGVGLLSFDEVRLKKASSILVSFAVGALLGDAFIHLIPEAFETGTSPLRSSLLILSGMILFFSVEKLLHHHSSLHLAHPHEQKYPELSAINVIGDAIHNFIDGVIIGASYLVSPAIGFSTTLAVILHESSQAAW